jgi:hypothetical protein
VRYRSVALASIVGFAALCVVAIGLACRGIIIREFHFASDYAPDDLQFRLLMSGTEAGPDGVIGDSYSYRASDCVRVDSVGYTFPTSLRAKQEMQSRISMGSRLLERTEQAVTDRALIEDGHYDHLEPKRQRTAHYRQFIFESRLVVRKEET